MPYFRIDDTWWSHPKTLALSPAARDLWARAGSWSMQHYTDGLLSKQALATLGARPKLIAELVAVGYWVEVIVGYAFHDWLDHQESAEKLKDRREQARERMRAKRAGTPPPGSRDVRANTTRTDSEQDSERSENVPAPPARAYAGAQPRSIPSHPVVDLYLDPSVPETSRETGPDEEDLSPYINAAMRLNVDFQKVAAKLAERAEEPVSPQLVSLIIREVVNRAKDRQGDRTGVVLTSIKNDWPEWSRIVFASTI